MAKKKKDRRSTERAHVETKQPALQRYAFLFGSIVVPVLLGLLLRNSNTKNSKTRSASFEHIRPSAEIKRSNDGEICEYYMAESTIPNAGLGVFTTKTLRLNDPVLHGDVVVQLPDLTTSDGLDTILHFYAWNSAVSGGANEGTAVHSILPGLGMLTNGHLKDYNLVPDAPMVDHANLSRDSSPNAGAFSHYHSLKHYAARNIPAGSELLLNYGTGWSDKLPNESIVSTAHRDPDWIRKHGVCLDNIKEGPSKIAGRGAVLTRRMGAGMVIAPVPVLPLWRSTLERTVRNARTGTRTKQLLLNYCFGHVNSSVVLFPYSPVVGYINHDGVTPNAKVRWSTEHASTSQLEPTKMTIHDLRSKLPSGLVLELVALRDMLPGEEVTINYGEAWQQEWEKHVVDWKPPLTSEPYMYAHDINNAQSPLPTVTEKPGLPDNLETQCYIPQTLLQQQSIPPHQIGMVSWLDGTPTRHHPSALQPCRVLERLDVASTYTVEISLPASPSSSSMPWNLQVSKVPRAAISTTNAPYSSDQHLAGAFRRWMEADFYPTAWMDLV